MTLLRQKVYFLGVLAAACVMARQSTAGPSNVSRAFDQATANHEQELAAAVDPSNRRYQAELENLLANAKREDDVDTIARVQQAMERLAVKPATLASLGPDALFVGAWVYIYHLDGRSYGLNLNPDRSCSQNGQRFGTWEVTPQALVIHYDGHPDWRDHYELPIRTGALTATNDDGYTMTITRRGAPVPLALQKDLFGAWNFRNLTDGRQSSVQLAPDGGYLVDAGSRRAGTWAVSGDMLVVSHGEQDGGRDLYELPVAGGIIYGKNLANHSLRLTRPGVTTSDLSADKRRSPVGRWQWHAGPDNTLTAAGQVLQHAEEVGRWEWSNQPKGELRILWKGGKYIDTLTLQPDGMHLAGHSSNGDVFAEERLP